MLPALYTTELLLSPCRLINLLFGLAPSLVKYYKTFNPKSTSRISDFHKSGNSWSDVILLVAKWAKGNFKLFPTPRTIIANSFFASVFVLLGLFPAY